MWKDVPMETKWSVRYVPKFIVELLLEPEC